MRFYAHALTSLMLLSILATASAEPLTERMVALLNDVCISPATPEEMMSAGEKAAAASGWNLLRSGPAPVPMLHNESGPKLARISGWTADLPGAPGSHVFISILGPELPDSKWNGCIIQPSVDFKREDVVSAVELHLGSFLTAGAEETIRRRNLDVQ